MESVCIACRAKTLLTTTDNFKIKGKTGLEELYSGESYSCFSLSFCVVRKKMSFCFCVVYQHLHRTTHISDNSKGC